MAGVATGRAPQVTCFALPIAGHVTPLLPVIAELAARGVTVRAVTSIALTPRFQEAGAEVVWAYPEAFTAAVQRPSHNFVEVAALLARWTERGLLAAAGRLLDEARPDVVVVDSMAGWGRLAAGQRELPVVTSTSSFLIDARLGVSPRAAADVLRRAGAAAGSLATVAAVRARLRGQQGVDCGGPLTLLSNRGDTTLVYTSRELQPGGGRFGDDVRFVGPTAAAGHEGRLATERDEAVTAWLAARRGGRPLAYVALGTIYNDRPAFLRSAAIALAGLGYDVILALGEHTTAAGLAPLPPGTLCLRDAPQLAILDRASLFVTHGGMNSVHEALWRAVPMVVFPQAADQPVVAARLEALGAARVLRGREPDATAIAEAARTVGAGGAAGAARRLGAGLRSAGGASAAAEAILARVPIPAGGAAGVGPQPG